MSYWIHKAGNGNNYLWRYFMCDYLSDIDKLPTAAKSGQYQPDDTIDKDKCCPGSQCLCLEDGSIWLLGKDTGKWSKHKAAANGTTATGGEMSAIPPSFIEALFS